MNQNVKVYETSIVPAGEKLEPIRAAKVIAPSAFIEVIHILLTAGILAFLFAGLWRKAVRAEKTASETA